MKINDVRKKHVIFDELVTGDVFELSGNFMMKTTNSSDGYNSVNLVSGVLDCVIWSAQTIRLDAELNIFGSENSASSQKEQS